MSKELSPLQALKELKKRYGKNFSCQDDERIKIIESALKSKERIETEIIEVLVNFDKGSYSNSADAIIEIRKILDKYE